MIILQLLKMKTLNKLLFYSLLLTIIATSCTTIQNVSDGSFIQKRKYNKGFHVNKSKNSHKENNNIVYNAKKIVAEETQKTKGNVIENTEKEAYSEELEASNEKLVSKQKFKNNNKVTPNYFTGFDFIKARKVLRKSDLKPNDDGLRFHWAAITGFVLGILSVVIIYLAIPAIVFSAIALSKIKQNPETYKGKGLALAGLIIGLTLTLLAILAIIFVILIFAMMI